MSDALGPHAKSLVRAARTRLPSDDDRARNRRAILKTIAAGAAATTVTGAASTAAASNGAGASAGSTSAFAGVAGAIKLGAALGVIAVAGAAGVSSLREASPAPIVAPSSSALIVASSASPRTALPALAGDSPRPTTSSREVVPPVRATSVASGSSARPSRDASALAAEVEALRAARKAMDEGHPAEAARILEQSSASIGEGPLSSERRGALLIARCRGAASAPTSTSTLALASDVDGFLRDHPGSPLASRVRAECGRITSTRDGE